MQGRRPKPTALKLIDGNPGGRPLNDLEPQPVVGAPTCPAHLSPTAKAEWKRLAQQLESLGIISQLDRAAFAAYCQAYARWVQAEKAIAKMAEKDQLTGGLMIKTSNGNAIQNPLVGIANKAMADMVRYAAEFGMTPSARSRINVEPPSENQDPAEAYF